MPHEIIQSLNEIFLAKGINTDRPGFLDEPEFLAAENEAPSFLLNYGRFVHCKQFDEVYLARAEKIIQIVAEGVHACIMTAPAQDRVAKCVTASIAIAQILNLHGIWNCGLEGAAIIKPSPKSKIPPFGFRVYELRQSDEKEDGHKWIYAPPFKVVDVTLKLQDYDHPLGEEVPELILARKFLTVDVQAADLIHPQVLRSEGIHGEAAIAKLLRPHQLAFMRELGAFSLKFGETTVKYVPISVTAGDEGLERLAPFYPRGERPFDYYKRHIKPLIEAIE